jgi:hypothetical protein
LNEEMAMINEIRKRIVRPATPEEKERHQLIREQIEQESPELENWARLAAARHQERVTIGTVLTADENNVLQAIDDYAVKHALENRSAVVREALANHLGIEIARQWPVIELRCPHAHRHCGRDIVQLSACNQADVAREPALRHGLDLKGIGA